MLVVEVYSRTRTLTGPLIQLFDKFGTEMGPTHLEIRKDDLTCAFKFLNTSHET